MRLGDRSYEGEAQAPGFSPIWRSFSGVKGFKDLLDFLWWNALTVIADGDKVSVALRLLRERDFYPAIFAFTHMLYGVDNYLEEHLVQVVRVSG